MGYQIRYSTRAFNEYVSILEYITHKFGKTKAAEVDNYFESIIDLIAINPQMFPYSNTKKNIRRCVFGSQTTLYYRFLGKTVELVSFRGNKMDPKKLGLI
jgi:plasmid stabilization system protein ParE